MLKPNAGTLFQHHRFKAQVTLAELSKKAACTQKTIVDFEKGRTNPQGHTIYRLAEALGVDPQEFFANEEVAS